MKRMAMTIVVAVLAAAAAGVMPATWRQATESDFAAGTLEGTVLSSLGEVRLARKTSVLVASGTAPKVISAVAVDGGTLYVGDGTQGAVWRRSGEKLVRYADTPGTMVASLLLTDGRLLAGTGGQQAGIYEIDREGVVKRIWSDAKVKYVWAIVAGGDGVLYAATGAEGAVYEIRPGGEAKTVYRAGELAKNILCLVRGEAGKLYAGTDTSGLVVEIDPAGATSRILLDAEENEVSALVVDGRGGLYAATADAAKAAAGEQPPNAAESGRADQAQPEPSTQPAPKPLPIGEEEGDEETTPAGRKTDAGPAAEPADESLALAPTRHRGEARAEQAERRPSEHPAAAPRAAGAPSNPAAAPAEQDDEEGPAETTASSSPGEFMRGFMEDSEGMPGLGAAGGMGGEGGNAVYHVAADGLVTPLVRRPVAILAMLRADDRLILGTGNAGQIYSVTLDGDEVVELADTDASQVTALVSQDGAVIFATSNAGSVGRLEEGVAATGMFTSHVMDAQQIARWGTLRPRADVPKGARLTVATRSGNVAEPKDGAWSVWSKEQPVAGDFLPIISPAGRFLQYRLTFAPAAGQSPAVHEVEIVYQVGNLPPRIQSVQVTPSAQAPDQGGPPAASMLYRIVAIAAADPNGDGVVFQIDMREVGTQPWVRIAKDLRQPQYAWDTRTTADGVYELRVTASDSPANPPASTRTSVRRSEAVVVDNTPPGVSQLAAKADGKVVTVTGVASDNLSRLVGVQYAVDSQTEWTPVLSDDGVCDSPRESFTFEVRKLEPGAHRIAVRAIDVFGNTGYGSVGVVAAD